MPGQSSAIAQSTPINTTTLDHNNTIDAMPSFSEDSATEAIPSAQATSESHSYDQTTVPSNAISDTQVQQSTDTSSPDQLPTFDLPEQNTSTQTVSENNLPDSSQDTVQTTPPAPVFDQ